MGFANLLVFSVIIDYFPDILEKIKRAMLCQDVGYYSKNRSWSVLFKYTRPKIELVNSANIDTVFKWPFILVGCIIFDIYAQRKNFILRKKLNAANITGSWAKKDSYDFIVTALDRFYGAGFYSLPS